MAVASPSRPPDTLVDEKRARRRRRLIGTTVVAVLAAVSLIAYVLAGRTASRPAVAVPGFVPIVVTPTCRASQLAISLVRTGAVMGQEGGLLRFTNVSKSVCRVSGWPTVIAVRPDGTRIASQHAVGGTMLFGWSWWRGRPLPHIRLRHGASGYAILAAGDTPSSPNPGTKIPASCPKARRLIVTVPRTSTTTTLSAWLPGDLTYQPLCGHPQVSPILPLSRILS